MEWGQLIISVLAGLSTCIPLVIKLVQYVQQVMKEKNWTNLMQLVLQLMSEAENNYETGAAKKEYVMDSINALKGVLNYDVDNDAVSAMIDAIAQASKKINK